MPFVSTDSATFDAATNRYNLTIVENSPADSVIGRVRFDGGGPGRAVYTLLGPDRLKVHIDDDGVIRLAEGVTLDHEGVDGAWRLSVDVSVLFLGDDGSVDTGETSGTAVTVTQVNNPIVWTHPPRMFSIAENSPGGTVVGQVSARDGDGDPVTYRLEGLLAGLFVIDATTGAISLAEGVELDYEGFFETGGRFDLGVVASATGPGGRSSSASQIVTIRLRDVDEAPVFDQERYDFTAAENTAPGVALGRVGATDPDEDVVTYSLTGTHAGMFTINDEGDLALKSGGQLDHEALRSTGGRITLTVTATSIRDGRSQSAAAEISLQVGDVDEAPVFRDDAGRPITSQTVRMNENVAGAVLTRLNAVDPDGDAPVRYFVMTQRDRFMIDDGQLRLKPGVALDYESLHPARIDVEISAVTRQTGERPMVTKMNVTVEVVNVDGQGKGEPDTYERPILSTATGWEDFADLQLSSRLAGFEPHLDRLSYNFSQSTVLYRVVDDPLAEGGRSTQVIVASFLRGSFIDNVLLEGVTDPVTPRNIHNSSFPIKHLVLGTNGDDRYDTSLDGTSHDDYIVGLKGRDQLDGGRGDDILVGGRGNDELEGGAGKDELYGGAGADRFDVSDVAGSSRRADIIRDFSRSDGDKLSVGRRWHVLYRHEDVDRDGLTDTVLYRYVEGYDRSNPAKHGVYAVLMDYVGDLTYEDFEPGFISGLGMAAIEI